MRFYEKLRGLVQNINFNLKGKTVLEIGSGWSPMMPYLLLLKSGCKEVLTFDINSHYSRKAIRRLNNYFAEQEGFDSWPEDTLHSSVRYFPKTDLAQNFPNQNIDIIVSRFVLEHISPTDLRKLHSVFYENLEEGSLIVHFISPSDHRAYADKNLSLFDFLKYSGSQWDRIQTRFDYHNRMRLPHYLEIFDETGFKVISQNHGNLQKDSQEHHKFHKLDIHPDFAQLGYENLTASSLEVVLAKRS